MSEELIYGYENSGNEPATVVEQAVSQNCRGILVDISGKYPLNDPRLAALRNLTRKAGMEYIVSLQCNPAQADERELKRLCSLTPLVALGDLKGGEFHGTPGLATAYKDLAKEMGFTWVCLLTHPRIILDIAGSSKIRDEIGTETLCMCMTGHVLAGYLFADSRVEWDERIRGRPNTPTHGKDLSSEYGVTIESVQRYLEPMRVVSGVGRQHGLSYGMHIYLRRLGFKGLIIGLPFDLSKAQDDAAYDPPESYPNACSEFESGYR